MLSVYDKIQNACFQLNHDAYILQSSQKKHMRQFSPCEKSLVLLECLREETHFGMAMAVASRTHCNCHNNLSEDGLWAMCFDDTARQNHYAGAARHLTKRAGDEGDSPASEPLSTLEVSPVEQALSTPALRA